MQQQHSSLKKIKVCNLENKVQFDARAISYDDGMTNWCHFNM